jgi:hypothetical protein
MSTAQFHVEDQTDQSTAPGILEMEPLSTYRTADLYPDVQCLCPHCGTFNAGVGKVCSHCQLPDNSETRSVSGQRPGRWFVLDQENPDKPGMEFQELQSLAECQLINSRSVVRGPGTGQLWRLASSIRGLSREFGVCYSCGGSIESDETICPHCDRSQKPLESNNQPKPVVAEPTPTPVAFTPIAPEAPTAIEDLPIAAPEPESIEITPPAPAVENKPSTPRVAVHVHTVSEPWESQERDLLIRPVIAEQAERHIPKDDLLTPRDVAKAFQLEFGTQSESYLRNTRKSRRMKIGFTAATALLAAVAVALPAVHVVNGWITANVTTPPAVDGTAPAAHHTEYADARPAGSLQLPGGASNFSPTPNEFTPPREKAGSTDPIIVADPSPSVSPEDDPANLLNQALDAESVGNYAKAVAAYERIESLPSNLWPAHLEMRLDLARKELKGEVR